MSNIILTEIGGQWSFSSEAQLEDFVWSSLEKIFNIIPLKSQFSINNQICDILALSQEKQLTIIELKNREDRYLVNQLTRYYDALITQKPLSDEIDYTKPIQLIAISPAFHSDNWSDKKYNCLDIQFWRFNIIQKAHHNFVFILENQENKKRKQIKFQYEPIQQEINIPEPSRKLLSIIADIPIEQRKSILNLRQQILGFHERMQEYSKGSAVIYGSAKNKSCAEIRFDSKRNNIALFIWIPYATATGYQRKQVVARIRVWTDWQEVTDMGHVPKGLGSMINFEEYKTASVRPLKKLLPRNSYMDSTERFFTDESYRLRWVKYRKLNNPHYNSGLALTYENYCSRNLKISSSSSSLKDFIDLALKTWVSRL